MIRKTNVTDIERYDWASDPAETRRSLLVVAAAAAGLPRKGPNLRVTFSYVLGL